MIASGRLKVYIAECINSLGSIRKIEIKWCESMRWKLVSPIQTESFVSPKWSKTIASVFYSFIDLLIPSVFFGAGIFNNLILFMIVALFIGLIQK